MITAALLCSCSIAMANLTEAGTSEDNSAMEVALSEAEKAETEKSEEEADKVQVNLPDENKTAESHTPQPIYTLDSDDLVEYVNPYRYEDDELEKEEVYWFLQRKSIDLVRRVCKEVQDKDWINVQFHYGFPTEFMEKGYFVLTDEEKSMFLCSITAELPAISDEGDPYMLVTAGLSEDCPEGKICCVRYFSPRGFDHLNIGVERDEILDAFNPRFWNAELAY